MKQSASTNIKRLFSSARIKGNDVVIVSAKRTPVGSFRSSLASASAVELGAVAVKAALSVNGQNFADKVNEVFMGNVVSADVGQAPAAQVSRSAGIPVTVPCTTVNKVCASGLKTVMLGAQSIALGLNDVVIAGGMESMSNAPFYVKRGSLQYGHQSIQDSIIKDGLWDAQYQIHMGQCAEETAKKFNITREHQDQHAVESYKRSAAAVAKGLFKNEIAPVTLKVKGKEVVISEDEEYKKVNFDKIPGLKPVFEKNGTVTAANASTLNDGASAVMLMSAEKAKQLGLKPLAKVLGYGDANRDPKEFTIAPADAIPKVLNHCGVKQDQVSLFEINEAFSVVVKANEKILGLDPKKVNVAGGAVSLGHPIGSSGCRILVTLTHLLESGEYGMAAICNGGGGASAMLIQKL
jgi:acetyl-CoA C-acetyltransferase